MTVLACDEVVKRYRTPGAVPLTRGPTVVAVDRASLEVREGRSLGIIGESGAGKSTLVGMLLRLTRPDAGIVRFRDQDIWTMDRAALRTFRRNVQAVLQDPFSSFDPRWPIGRSVQEPLVIHHIGTSTERQDRIRRALDAVRLPAAVAGRYPPELSGGQLQRAAIARALICEPSVIVCDEPLSALDVSIQTQIAALLLDIQADRGVSYVIISHDLAMASVLAHDIVVMQQGVVVESGPVDQIVGDPHHPYTSTLIDAVRR